LLETSARNGGGNQQPEFLGKGSNGSETHSITRTVMGWDTVKNLYIDFFREKIYNIQSLKIFGAGYGIKGEHLVMTKEEYFKLKNQGYKRKEIAETLGYSESQLKKLITKNGWGQKRPTVNNSSLFLTLSEMSCYWAGFIAADGCLKDNGTLSICLNYDDTDHLRKFKEVMGSTHKITSNTDKYYRSELSFKHKDVERGLKENFNITPRKSLTYKAPESLTEPYIKHFLRGYFDGDGCICETFSNKNSKTASLYCTVTGTKEVIDFYAKHFSNLNGSISKRGNNIHTLKYNTNNSFTLLSYLYSGSNIYLDRKYFLYKRLVEQNIRQTR